MSIFEYKLNYSKMEKSKFVRSFLFVAGIIGIGIGGSMLFIPVAFEASAGIDLAEDINLQSELRAPGGMILALGIIITAGVFFSKITYFSMQMSCLFYLSYGVARMVGIIIDGLPNDSFLIAMAIELILGGISLLLLYRYRNFSLAG